MFIVRTDSVGEELWIGYYSLVRSRDECQKIIQNEDSGYTFIGQADGYSNMCMVKTGPDPVVYLI